MSIRDRTTAFCDRFGLRVPILLAPMAGASAPALSVAVANAGGLGACGALLMARPEIVAWANQVRAASNGRFQINLWIPDPTPVPDAAQEKLVRDTDRSLRPPRTKLISLRVGAQRSHRMQAMPLRPTSLNNVRHSWRLAHPLFLRLWDFTRLNSWLA